MYVVITNTGEFPDDQDKNIVCYCTDEDTAINMVKHLDKVRDDKSSQELCKLLDIFPSHMMFFEYEEVESAEYIHRLLDNGFKDG